MLRFGEFSTCLTRVGALPYDDGWLQHARENKMETLEDIWVSKFNPQSIYQIQLKFSRAKQRERLS